MSQTFRFNSNGQIDCLYTEVIDLRALGQLHVTRATEIRFNGSMQQWEVYDRDHDALLFSHPSRSHCLIWEQLNLQVD